MSKKQKTFTDEEKHSIALQATAGGEEAVRKLAEKHDVSEEEIRTWIRETDVTPASEISEQEEVSLEATDEFIAAVNYGANYDKLNYKRLLFWSVFGIAVILFIVQSIKYVHDYSETTATQLRSEESNFYEIDELKSNEQETLDSFGVIDPEAGIYRIPIDSAITLIANE